MVEIIAPQVNGKDVISYILLKEARTVKTMTSRTLLRGCVKAMPEDMIRKKQGERESVEIQCELIN